MKIAATSELDNILRCPRCQSFVEVTTTGNVMCLNPSCEYSSVGFLTVGGQPVLIDFEDSIFNRSNYSNGSGSVLPRDDRGQDFIKKLGGFILYGRNTIAERVANEFIKRLKDKLDRPKILVIGGGAVGGGTSRLYGDPDLMLVGTDVYASPNTVLVADAHRLPFANACFDGVWIQAVLEHVLEPHTVAAEIFRVLKPSGLVYADTPFMQQVHEQAYDFTRFTLSGHRWLFRNFSEIESGVVAGAGTAAVWSMRYFWRALTGNTSLGTLLAAPFFWLRFFDKLAKPRHNADAASGVFFFGMKGNESLRPKDMVTYYEMQKVSVG